MLRRQKSKFENTFFTITSVSGHETDVIVDMQYPSAAHVLIDDYNTVWIADDHPFPWFILDLGAPMSYDAVIMANTWCPPFNDGSTDRFV